MNGAATAHIDKPHVEAPTAVVTPVSTDQHGSTTLPADGIVLAEATAYRTVDRKFLSHTDGMVRCQKHLGPQTGSSDSNRGIVQTLRGQPWAA